MNKFIEQMMEIGAWEDRACSKIERDNAVKAAEELYDKHISELKLLGIADAVGRSEQLVCECCKDRLVEEQGNWCQECLDNPSRFITN